MGCIEDCEDCCAEPAAVPIAASAGSSVVGSSDSVAGSSGSFVGSSG